MKKLRGVCLGAGYFSRFQYEAWARIPEVEIVALANRSLEKARETAALHHSPRAYAWADIAGSHAGKISGTMNMAGNLGSALVALAFPYLIVRSGGPNAFFYLGSALSIAGVIAWFFAQPDRKLS